MTETDIGNAAVTEASVGAAIGRPCFKIKTIWVDVLTAAGIGNAAVTETSQNVLTRAGLEGRRISVAETADVLYTPAEVRTSRKK